MNNDTISTPAAAKTHLFGLPKNIFFLGVTSFFTDISSEMIYPLIPIFLTSILGAPVAIVGLIEGIAESTASVLKVFSGWLSDRVSQRKKLTVFGYGLSACSKPIFVFAFSWWYVLVARFADRVGKGIRTAPRDALIADAGEKDKYGISFGFHRGMDTLGAAIGPLLAFALFPLFNHNYRIFFLLSVIPAVIGVCILAFFVKEKARILKNEKVKLSLKPFDKKFKLFLLIVLIFTLGNSSDVFLLLRAQNVGIATGFIPLVYFLFNIVYAMTSPPVGQLSDKIGRKEVIVVGYSIFAMVYFGFAVVQSAFMVWILFAVYGLYYAFTESILKAFTADMVPSELRGTAYGFLNLVLGIALFPASLVAGILWDRISPRAPFYYGSIMACVAVLLFVVFIPSSKEKQIIS